MNTYYKYPRTFHLPFSPGVTSDDKVLSLEEISIYFKDKFLTVTEKMDGENTTMYSDHIHARSLDSIHHPSRNWVKRFHSEIAHNIPPRWRICGENLFAKHSISYDNLDSYFYGFSIWNEENICLGTDETKEWFELLGIKHVPILQDYLSTKSNWYAHLWDYADAFDTNTMEGFVVRNRDSFHYSAFKENILKCVRSNHVQTDQHWMHSGVIPNQLKME